MYSETKRQNKLSPYYFIFENDSLMGVYKGVFNLGAEKEIDYDKYATYSESKEPEEGVMPEIEINILDGEINSGSITLKTEDIIKDCKKECVTFTISSDEWCDCMNQCSRDIFDKNKISFGNMNTKIFIEECPKSESY